MFLDMSLVFAYICLVEPSLSCYVVSEVRSCQPWGHVVVWCACLEGLLHMMTHILAMCPSTEDIWRTTKSIPYYVLKVAKSMVGYKSYIYICIYAVELCLDNSNSKDSFVSWLGQTTCWYCWPTPTEIRLMYRQINPLLCWLRTHCLPSVVLLV